VLRGTWFCFARRFPRARDFHHDLMRRGNIMRVCRGKRGEGGGGFSLSFLHARMPRKTESGGADRARDACESACIRCGRDFNDGDFIRVLILNLALSRY